MPYQTPCPNCLKVGLVRYEHVITGKVSSRAYYCGSCDYQWSVADQVPPPVSPYQPFPRPRTRLYGPKRRG